MTSLPISLETFPAAHAVELAVVERSGFVESRHLGSAVVLAPDGSVERTLGDATTAIFPRSTLKMVQAAVCLSLGADLHGAQAGIATASHSGAIAHAEVVKAILSDGDFTVLDLGCPPAWPSNTHALEYLIRANEEKSSLWMNCSGKHAAMLRACRAQNWETKNYLDPAHPLQCQIAKVLEKVAGERIASTGVDGCGAPLFALSLTGLAHATQWATTARIDSEDDVERAAARVVAGVRENPWVIHGPGEHNTVVIEKLGVFAKGGAEGVIVMTAPDGRVVALKILDGSSRATSTVALELLVQAGSISAEKVEEIEPDLDLAIIGGANPVGKIHVRVA